mmetsp:Transcript_10409/g.15122  ORF Transcript_10409/g.15122 Transcript_10409/m.15122 type:complete len:309 (+) Transcript_10409:19-945(+)
MADETTPLTEEPAPEETGIQIDAADEDGLEPAPSSKMHMPDVHMPEIKMPEMHFDSVAFKAGATAAAAKTAQYSKVAAAKSIEYSKKGAVMATAKAAVMTNFIMDGPIGFRVLAFTGGLCVVGMSIATMVEDNIIFHPWKAIASFFNVMFGFIIMIIESTALFKRTPWRKDIYEAAPFLRTTFGRGMSYLFIGINMTAQDFGIFAFFTGVYMVAVGVILSLVGYFTQKKLSNLHHHLNNEEEVMVMFDLMDADGDGTLDQEEFAELCKHLGVPLRKTELLAVFDVIDTSDVGQRKNTITKEEFFSLVG